MTKKNEPARTWTATSPSGWCAMDLHGHEDGRIEDGYCRLDGSQCGCGCHRGEQVRRKRAWTPSDEPSLDDYFDDDEDDDSEEAVA